MSFIRIYPLEELVAVETEAFGFGEPARCKAESGLAAQEFYLAINQIAAFEECPLYLVSRDEHNTLIDGIRIRMLEGRTLLLPDDAANEEDKFTHLLSRASKGEVVEMPVSPTIRMLARQLKLSQPK